MISLHTFGHVPTSRSVGATTGHWLRLASESGALDLAVPGNIEVRVPKKNIRFNKDPSPTECGYGPSVFTFESQLATW
jgi:hypothetical protein